MGGDVREQRMRVLRFFHATHAVRDVHPARIAYLIAFGGITFLENYYANEDRDGVLLYVANQIVEVQAPRNADAQERTFARFLARHGEAWHSMAFTVKDAREAGVRLREAGYQIVTEHPGFLMLHPRSTGGVVVELCDVEIDTDPYYLPGWNRDWAATRTDRPRRLALIACVVPALAPMVALLTEQLDGRVTAETDVLWPQPARCVDIAISDICVRLLCPVEGDDGPLTRYLAGPRSGVYAVGWEIVDTQAAAAIFAAAGLAASAVPGGDVSHEVILHGARHWFCPAPG